MNAVILRLHKEFGIECDSAPWCRVELHHPASDARGIELFIPRGVERIGKVDALAVATDFDHLRASARRWSATRSKVRLNPWLLEARGHRAQKFPLLWIQRRSPIKLIASPAQAADPRVVLSSVLISVSMLLIAVVVIARAMRTDGEETDNRRAKSFIPTANHNGSVSE
jgi:hypothetical protein